MHNKEAIVRGLAIVGRVAATGIVWWTGMQSLNALVSASDRIILPFVLLVAIVVGTRSIWRVSLTDEPRIEKPALWRGSKRGWQVASEFSDS